MKAEPRPAPANYARAAERGSPWYRRALRSAVLPMTAVLLAQSAPATAQDRSRFDIPPSVDATTAAALKQSYAGLAAIGTLPKAVTAEDWDRQNATLGGIMAAQAKALARNMRVTLSNDRIGGVPVVRLRPAVVKPSQRVFIYLHGGGYVFFSASNNINVPVMFASLARQEVVSVDYTLAPRSKWNATTDQVLAVYQALLKSGHRAETIGIFGDSAGGGLAAASVLKMRDLGLPLPGALWLLSPWTDLTLSGDTGKTLAGQDPILDRTQLSWSAAAYADPADQKNPYVSPVFGDYGKAFPPTLIQAGTHELLLSDAVRQYQALRNGGHEAALDVYEGLPHVFQAMVPETPAARKSIQRAITFFDAHLAPKR